MTTYFIGRHAGTVAWIKRQPITIDVFKPENRLIDTLSIPLNI